MKDLNIPGTQSTPAITADPARGLLTMRGDSYPEKLFGPVRVGGILSAGS